MAGIQSEYNEAGWSHIFKCARLYMGYQRHKINRSVLKKLRVWWVRWITPFPRCRLTTQSGSARKGVPTVRLLSQTV